MKTRKIKKMANEYFSAEEKATVIPDISEIKAYDRLKNTANETAFKSVRRMTRIKRTALIAATLALVIGISAAIPAIISTDTPVISETSEVSETSGLIVKWSGTSGKSETSETSEWHMKFDRTSEFYFDMDSRTSEKIVLPPTRVGTEGTMKPSLDKPRTFETAFEESDIVALVRVGNWLSEESGYTCFDATVLEQYKGAPIDSFVLREDGDSEMTFKASPIFTYGNEMLLFLKMDDEAVNNYWIVGTFTTIVDAVNVNNEWYFLDRLGMLSTGNIGFGISYNEADEYRKNINNEYRKTDKFAEENNYFTPFVYTREEIINKINKFEGFVERIPQN